MKPHLKTIFFFLLSFMTSSGPLLSSAIEEGKGLKGEYYNGVNFEKLIYTRVDEKIDFKWSKTSPAPGVNKEYFSIRWTGKLFAPASGKYKISIRVDDGVRLWMGGVKLIDEWRQQEPTTYTYEVDLKENKYYDLKIEYYNDWLESIIELSWEAPQNATTFLGIFDYTPDEIIPGKYLFDKILPKKPASVAAVTDAIKPEPAAKSEIPGEDLIKKQPLPKVSKKSIRSSNAKNNTDQEITFADLKTGEAIILQNVLFVQSKAVILESSFPELDKLVKTLKAKPEVRIEIRGHTDNVGNAQLNQTLSESRAKVIGEYLIAHGIEENRIEVKGFGGSVPITDNSTEEERAKNRRVEFVVK